MSPGSSQELACMESFREYSPRENSHDTSSEVFSSSFLETSSKLRVRPDIGVFYKTPSGGRKFSRRSSVAVTPVLDYFERYEVPEIVLLRICSYLNKKDLISLAKTSKRFLGVCYNSRFWTFINLENVFISEAALHSILDRRTEVMRLMSANIEAQFFASWYYFPADIPARLTHLDLSRARFSEPIVLVHILERCTQLKALSLEAVSPISEAACEAIAKNSELRILNLLMCRQLTKAGISAIMKGCKRLVELNAGWTQLDSAALAALCEALPSTTRRLSLAGVELTDECLERFCARCPNLVEADLSDNIRITERSVKALRDLPKLRMLNLSRCYDIEPVSFLSLGHLEVLNIFQCLAEQGLDLIRQRLQHTDVNATPFVTIARPTVNEAVTSIWGQRTRDWY